jgi:septin family protein
VGKSTLLESLFKRSFGGEPHDHTSENVGTEVQTYDLEDGGVKLKLTIVNSTGYGDQLNRAHSADKLVSYVEAQFEQYLQEELKTSRVLPVVHDTRIHACLYLLAPTGHSLKSVDLFTMKAIHQKVQFSARFHCELLTFS